MAGAWEIRDTYETSEQWARLRGDHSLIRDKTALAILVLAESIHYKDQPMLLDEILAGYITGTIDMKTGVREAA